MRYRITGKASEPAAGFQNRFRSVPRMARRDLSPGRLLMRQTACARRLLPAMIGGGTWEGAHARHEATGVRQRARRRGRRLADRGASAAGGMPVGVGFFCPGSPANLNAHLRGRHFGKGMGRDRLYWRVATLPSNTDGQTMN